MGSRKKSNTASLVEGGEQPSERLSLEETWPADHGLPVPVAEVEEDGTVVSDYDPNETPSESTAHPDNMAVHQHTADAVAYGQIGLSNSGPFIATAEQVQASLIPELTPEQRKEAEAALDKRFEAFSEALYKACYTHGFLIYPQAAQDMGPERSRLKRSRRVATALASMVCVLATPEPKR